MIEDPDKSESPYLPLRTMLIRHPFSDSSKRAKNFISSKGYPRYCTATTLPDGTTVLNGGRSRRGKPRGPPGSRELQVSIIFKI